MLNKMQVAPWRLEVGSGQDTIGALAQLLGGSCRVTLPGGSETYFRIPHLHRREVEGKNSDGAGIRTGIATCEMLHDVYFTAMFQYCAGNG